VAEKKAVSIAAVARWILGLFIAVLVGGVPVVFFRWQYTHEKRFREIVPGRIYRSGQMTVAGFEETVRRYGIRSIVNVQDDYPDPDIAQGFFDRHSVKETELCRQLGVRFYFVFPDLVPHSEVSKRRPQAIDQFLAILDDPSNYPLLLHCKAGLHRTGCLTAVYRMEYEGWSPHEAINEMKDNGFGEWVCSAANDYISQYVLTYRRGLRNADPGTRSPELSSALRAPSSEFPVLRVPR
jgi:protein tyrosine phosphatase (PTP) superfamily phosphohydrolase (DUF442 family)